MLAKLRYNRLIDVFTGLTCYPLQSHLRTTIEDKSQVETDDIYIGVDRHGAHYVIPVQAKGDRETLGAFQVHQDFAICRTKFPDLIPLPISAQFLDENIIALFAFEKSGHEVTIYSERHYQLVSLEDLSDEELQTYKDRANLQLS